MINMLKEYKKIIIMTLILLILIIGIVVVLTSEIKFGKLRSVAIFTMSESKEELDNLIEREASTKAEQQSSLEKTKNSYEAEKQKFEKIDKSTLDMIREATKDEKYFIEYLWITLGNYADENNLAIEIITPGSTSAVTGESMGNAGASGNGSGSNTQSKPNLDASVSNGAIRIVVRGRYANVADFVYDVENDKELKFRLDNIKMSYKSNNQIEATFNVLNLQLKK